ncbi:MAG: DUF3303 domain-containing protein [Acidobacteriia bacterium]|nr:DUF3303 domain-containing protein [Terriglobia bacterium]
MLFMVIERYRNGDPKPVGERFKTKGRMLPDGLSYVASWLEPSGARCFQLMEAERRELFDAWISHWDDLADFEVIPVLTSAEFWAKRE